MVVKLLSEYHFRVSAEQVADRVELFPLQIVLGEAVRLVGVLGITLTDTVTEAAELLHEPETQAA